MPTGIPKTDVEKRADVLMAQIEKNAKELYALALDNAANAKKLSDLRSYLNGGGG